MFLHGDYVVLQKIKSLSKGNVCWEVLIVSVRQWYPASDLCRLASSTHSGVGDFCITFARILTAISALHLGLLTGKGVRKLVVQKGDSWAQRKWREKM